MRLFGKINATIDRFDRAGWLTLPFDLDLRPRPPLYFIEAAVARSLTAAAGKAFTTGAAAGLPYSTGAIAGEVSY